MAKESAIAERWLRFARCDVSIQAAIAANDVFIARLEAIRDRAQTLTIEYPAARRVL
jgi:hypothetical protein